MKTLIITLLIGIAFAIGRLRKSVPGVLTLGWTGNQAFDAPNTTGTQSIAAAGSATLNADAGVLTLTGATAAAGAVNTFTLNNSQVGATDRVYATINDYAGTLGTNGVPVLVNATSAAGSIVFNIVNVHAANALSGDITLSFMVGKAIQ